MIFLFFIKIDLEGYDFNAVYGSKNLLNNYFTIILFEFSKIALKNEIYSKEIEQVNHQYNEIKRFVNTLTQKEIKEVKEDLINYNKI